MFIQQYLVKDEDFTFWTRAAGAKPQREALVEVMCKVGRMGMHCFHVTMSGN